jgi:hypothetical protein
MTTKHETVRSFTFCHDRTEDDLLLSIVTGDGHKWYSISANQAALALSQLASYVAEQARDKYPPDSA